MTGAVEDGCGTKLPVGDAATMDLDVKLKRLQSLRAQIVAAKREYWKLTSEEDRHRFYKLCEELDIGKSYSFICPPTPLRKCCRCWLNICLCCRLLGLRIPTPTQGSSWYPARHAGLGQAQCAYLGTQI